MWPDPAKGLLAFSRSHVPSDNKNCSRKSSLSGYHCKSIKSWPPLTSWCYLANHLLTGPSGGPVNFVSLEYQEIPEKQNYFLLSRQWVSQWVLNMAYLTRMYATLANYLGCVGKISRYLDTILHCLNSVFYVDMSFYSPHHLHDNAQCSCVNSFCSSQRLVFAAMSLQDSTYSGSSLHSASWNPNK